MFESIEEFLDYWNGMSNEKILDMENFIIALVKDKGWDIDRLKKYLEDVKKGTEKATEENRVKQAEEKIAKILEESKNETDLEKRKKSLEEIGELVEEISPKETPKAYTSAEYENETKNYDPDKYFSPKLFGKLAFPDGTLSVIGARTSRGKTTALINLAAEAMEVEETKGNKRKVLFITLEMSSRQLYNKLILQRVYAKADKDTRKNILDNDKVKKDTHKNLFKIIKDANELTGIDTKFIDSVKEAKGVVDEKVDAKELQIFQAWRLNQQAIINLIRQQEKGTLVLIDYIQRMPLMERASRERYIQIKEISNALMNATIESEVVTICAAQFNRTSGKDNEGDDAFTDISFRESGDIEQDAHNAIGIGWEEDKKTRFYEILKARESGETGDTSYFDFNGAYSYMFMNGKKRDHKQKAKEKEGSSREAGSDPKTIY